MIPAKTLVRAAPFVCRNVVQSRGITRTTNVVSVPPSVQISFAVCNLQMCSLIVFNSGRIIFLSYSVDSFLNILQYAACACIPCKVMETIYNRKVNTHSEHICFE